MSGHEKMLHTTYVGAEAKNDIKIQLTSKGVT